MTTDREALYRLRGAADALTAQGGESFCPYCNPCRHGELLSQYDSVLRGLASYLGAGGFNSGGLIDPKVADAKIRWGIEHMPTQGGEQTDTVSVPREHPDDIAVRKFADAMRDKMARKRAQGRGGWDNPSECSIERLEQMFAEHVSKGDMVDIANFAMMLWHRKAAAKEGKK